MYDELKQGLPATGPDTHARRGHEKPMVPRYRHRKYNEPAKKPKSLGAPDQPALTLSGGDGPTKVPQLDGEAGDAATSMGEGKQAGEPSGEGEGAGDVKEKEGKDEGNEEKEESEESDESEDEHVVPDELVLGEAC